MAVTYDKIAFTKIEKELRDSINNDFNNVYISHDFKMVGTECIRINLINSTNLETTNAYEQREYNVEIRYYFNTKILGDSVNDAIKAKSDRLRKKLIDIQVNTPNWAYMDIEEIDYGVEDEENEENSVYIVQYTLSLINHNPLN
tara:strand:- start:383 stop:814 length:432 start_codon:yes stop_codon:yes gene_type:complete